MRYFILLFLIINFSYFYNSAYARPDHSPHNSINKNNFSHHPEVKLFIQDMVKHYSFRETELNKLFDQIKLRPIVIKQSRSPLEQLPWYTYQRLYVSEANIRNGLIFWKKYEPILKKAQEKFGVPASIIVATIGIETKYGLKTGEFRVIDALANLAFVDTRRSRFFQNELKEFLLLSRERHINPLTIFGSYSGAIGQPQFMPSSYRRYAVSFTGDHPVDLSHNEADIIASIANYYKLHGWQNSQLIAAPVSLTHDRFHFWWSHDTAPKVILSSKAAEYGMDSTEKLDKQPYKLITLQTYLGKEYWLGFHNFDVIKKYNSSDLYAMAVLQLSHYIVNLKETEDV